MAGSKGHKRTLADHYHEADTSDPHSLNIQKGSGIMTSDFNLAEDAGHLLYTFLCTFPYIILILFSFKGHWRFKKSITFLISALEIIMQMSIFMIRKYLLNGSNGPFWAIFSNVLDVIFIYVAIKDHPGKLAFALIMISNLGTFIIMLAKCLEGFFFPEQSNEWYNFTYHPFIVLVLIVVLPVIYRLVFRDFVSTPSAYEPYTFTGDGKKVWNAWRYLWLVPVLFYLMWMQFYYGGGKTTLENAKDPMNVLYLFFIDAGSVLVYRIIINATNLYERHLSLLAENHANSIQRLSYESLNIRLENLRKTRHDLRHHVAFLKQIRNSGDISALDELINEYTETNNLDQPIFFCENETINIVLAYYSEIAYENNIPFSVKADIPEETFVEKKDLSVIFGNILENATDACKEVEGERFIDLVATYKTAPDGKHSFMLSVKNNYATEPVRNEDDVFSSTKHEGNGIGVSSVQSIARKYDGVSSFMPEEGVFSVSLILNEK